MQRICPVPGGVKEYLRNPSCLVTPETRQCPFCPRDRKAHRLRILGKYERQALLPGENTAIVVPVVRLLCRHVGQTVSLLPDFCLSRRQHGPGILGLFLTSYIIEGVGLLAAIRRARPEVRDRSVPRNLLIGFRLRLAKLRAYLASVHLRVAEIPDHIPRRHRILAPAVLGLLQGFPCAVTAFVHHACRFHHRFQLGLA
jgi:hypothetical protein